MIYHLWIMSAHCGEVLNALDKFLTGLVCLTPIGGKSK